MMVRDDVVAALSGATQIGNSVLRVMSDAKAGLAHLVLRYIDWLSRQLLPDTAEVEWLDRHGNIWLKNSDGSKGRKAATLAAGSVTLTGLAGTSVAMSTVLLGTNADYETTEGIVLGTGPTEVAIRALDGGVIGNLDAGEQLDVQSPVAGLDSAAIVVVLEGGADEESDDLLRERVLLRIQNPPMGGDLSDYVAWTLSIPGVTRAWAAQEMGIGTITVRFMMDELRVAQGGIPNAGDLATVRAYLDEVRPATVKDCFVEAPVPYNYYITITDLDVDNSTVRARISESIKDMELRHVSPGQTMYRSWIDEAISSAIGESHHELLFTTTVMPAAGYIPVLGVVTYSPGGVYVLGASNLTPSQPTLGPATIG
jgi:uncharacterized phage protein gp47/JayE